MAYHKPINYAITFFVFCMLLIQEGCITKEEKDLALARIIPKPLSVTGTGHVFKINRQTVIYVQEGSDELMGVGQFLAEKLRPATGFPLEVKATSAAPEEGVYLALAPDISTGSEGYRLEITPKLVSLTASAATGAFYGVQTIRQILPAKIEQAELQKGPWYLATGTITDHPDYGYRGMMLDVARHFFGVDDVKKLIDQMAYYKLNMLHLHLADDQGWRIEIKSWPNLSTIGGKTEVGGGEGGFYTQEQYADLVNYAKSRFITVIPEIDMPGHTNAALASYAELNCNGKATELYTGTDVGFSTLCTKKEVVYKFIDDVFAELAALTPGPYLHMGGDESHATALEDYIPFVNRVQEIVRSHGKQIIGWDEIALSALKDSTIAQYWAKADNARKAVEQGAKIIMSPAAHAYLDMKYDSTTVLGLHWAGYIEVDKGYNWDPASLVPEIKKENILGIEAPLWSETVTNLQEVELLVFPRLQGYAEIGWTPAGLRNWDEYKLRLANHGERMKARGINFFASNVVPWELQK